MYKCEICNKEFNKIAALSGHKAWHVNRTGADKIAAKNNGHLKKERNIKEYMLNPLTCKHCNNIIPYEKSTSKKQHLKYGAKFNFCNSSCSAKYNNSRRTLSKETKTLISDKVKSYYNSLPKVKKDKQVVECICLVCSCTFTTTSDKKRKTCSAKCNRLNRSLRRQKYIQENGTFSTLRETFVYNQTIIQVDSNLEKAGIIYLLEHLHATCVERFNNLIWYNNGNENKTYNPDFICLINNQTYIVEVKQKWYNTSTHVYNTSIPYKKKALIEFCNAKGYQALWLDFDTAPEMKKIYKSVLNNRNKKDKIYIIYK